MNFLKRNKQAIIGTAACLLIGGIALSFQDTPFNHIQKYQVDPSDTVPEKKCCPNGDNMTMKEFEKLPECIDKEVLKAMEEVKKIDWAAIQQQIEGAMKSVDAIKIQTEVEKALKDVDFEKISKDVTTSLASLKEVDWAGVNKDIKDAMDEVKSELKNINKDEIKKEIDDAKLEIEKSKAEMKNINMDQIMKEAKEGVEEAKAELKEIKTMFDEMEKDGLINKKAGFKIEYKEKELYINDKKQTSSVTDKYRHYFKDDSFKIKIDKEN